MDADNWAARNAMLTGQTTTETTSGARWRGSLPVCRMLGGGWRDSSIWAIFNGRRAPCHHGGARQRHKPEGQPSVSGRPGETNAASDDHSLSDDSASYETASANSGDHLRRQTLGDATRPGSRRQRHLSEGAPRALVGHQDRMNNLCQVLVTGADSAIMRASSINNDAWYGGNAAAIISLTSGELCS